MCPLAKVMRKELKDRRIKKLKVVYSTEQPRELKKKIINGKKVTPGSISFVPSVGGLTIASVVVNDLLNK
jgi:tRNA A37 threonylcarbamoyladenosine dehydratase